MVIFEIRNKAEKRRLLGYLFYFERSKRFFAEVLDEVDEWSAPFLFSGHVKKGIRSIDSIWTEKFVRQRIIPSDRQNLGSILRENGLKKYDEYKLLQLSEGRCVQDELYLVRVTEKEISAGVKRRLREKVLDVMPLRNMKALVCFKNGESRIADLKDICGGDPVFGKILSDEKLFYGVRVSPGGNGIEWGEERFVSAQKLKSRGKISDIRWEDILRFIRDRLLDTAEVSEMLQCSRQYVDQLADKGRLTSVRKGARSVLYTKGSLEAESVDRVNCPS